MNHKTTDLFFLRCLTNTHVGSGDTTYGVVDKIVQRDTITGLPVIHSSGLKGSFRELMAYIKKPNNPVSGNEDPAVVAIFGAKKDAKGLSAGSHTFHDAHLLVIPIRSNVKPFFRATSKERLNEFLDKVALFVSKEKRDCFYKNLEILLKQDVERNTPVVFDESNTDVRLENWRWQADRKSECVRKAVTILGENIAILHDDDFTELCRELPVIARNNLENGISQNLWYEEVVPRESVFYSFVTYGTSETQKLWCNLNSGNLLLQVGANATIGYGLCEIKKWNYNEKQTN